MTKILYKSSCYVVVLQGYFLAQQRVLLTCWFPSPIFLDIVLFPHARQCSNSSYLTPQVMYRPPSLKHLTCPTHHKLICNLSLPLSLAYQLQHNPTTNYPTFTSPATCRHSRMLLNFVLNLAPHVCHSQSRAQPQVAAPGVDILGPAGGTDDLATLSGAS